MDDQVDEYLLQLTHVVSSVLEDRMLGLYLIGSHVFDDFDEKMSDVDVLCVVERSLKESEKLHLKKRLSHEALPSPGVGLEFKVVLQSEAAEPHSLPSYDFALKTGEHHPTKVKQDGMDEGLLIDFAICLQSGKRLAGHPVEEVFRTIPRPWLKEAMKGILRWHEMHIFHPYYDPYGHEAVLNACRTWKYYQTGILSSKTDGVRFALKECPTSKLLSRALEIRQGFWDQLLEEEEVRELLQNVIHYDREHARSAM